MLLTKTAPSTSKIWGEYGDVYRFDPDHFWEGGWGTGSLHEIESDLIRITRKEFLKISSEVPDSGCICQSEQSHAALYKILLGRQYPHFGVTGIKTLYLIMCIEGMFGNKYKNITTHEAIKKLIGGRADCSHASIEFWGVCYQRIKEQNVSARMPLREYTKAEREIWRAFIRRASISCNKKKLK